MKDEKFKCKRNGNKNVVLFKNLYEPACFFRLEVIQHKVVTLKRTVVAVL